jgi:two-component system sensor histidine kinase EvgS
VSIQRLLAELLRSNRADRQELLDIARGANRQAITEAAHKIKGVARIVQANSLIQLCEALEQACQQGASPERIDEGTHALCRAMAELEQALETEIAKAN